MLYEWLQRLWLSLLVALFVFWTPLSLINPAVAASIEALAVTGDVLSYNEVQAYASGALSDVKCTIRLDGKIETGDAGPLERILDKEKRSAVICLDSLGGSYAAALKIAEMILRRARYGFFAVATAVPRNARCFSACALIFMSGSTNGEEGNLWQRRWLHVQGQLGFHAPYLPGSAVADEQKAQTLFPAGLSAVRKLLEFGRSIVGTTNMKRQFPTELILEMLGKGPNELFLIDTFGKASRYHIDLVGALVPKRVSASGLCNVCQHYNIRYSDGEDLLGTGDCRPDEVRNVQAKQRRFVFRGEAYLVLDFGGMELRPPTSAQ